MRAPDLVTPEQMRAAFKEAYAALERLDAALMKLCPTCEGQGVVAVPLPGETGSGERTIDEYCPTCRYRNGKIR